VPVDPELAELFDETAVRSIRAYERLAQQVTDMRRALDDDRRRDDDRFKAIERRLDCLVEERRDADGNVTLKARPVSVDWKLLVAFLSTVVVPIVVVLLAK
jgi:hypothetical protein